MQNQPVTLQLQTIPSTKGIEVLAITAGIGNGWTFKSDVLRASLALWEQAQVYTDHTPDKHSVRDLGGVFSSPTWDDSAQAPSVRSTARALR